MQRINQYIAFLYLSICSIACRSTSTEGETVQETVVQTPVTVVSVARSTLSEYIELSATSVFLQSNIVKASANGYVQSVNVSPGQFVPAGKPIFSIQTKESKNIGTIINNLDSSYRFSGVSIIKASQAGYITQLNHQAGDYVQDGEQLAAISTTNSFGFVLNLPYEIKRLVSLNKTVDIDLPDGTHLKGTVASMLPAMDSVSQTQRVMIRVNSTLEIPENLIARVKILKTKKDNVIAFSKDAVLNDESQTNFWVMKMIDSVTAVKVPVITGTETDGKIEIIQPQFATGDQIITSGNYGLADTAKVKIVHPEK